MSSLGCRCTSSSTTAVLTHACAPCFLGLLLRLQVYVQHLLEQQGAAVWKLIADRGHVYVCGATRMGHDVAAAFERVFQAHGGHSPEGAAALMQDLHASGRYIVELWS